MELLHIHSKSVGPRFQYVFSHVFEKVVGWPIEVHTEIRSFDACEGPKLNYSETECPGSYQIVPAGLLETESKEIGPKPVEVELGIVAFGADGEMGFDPFSFIFFLLSRMEEYQPELEDEHGRFPTSHCWMVRNESEKVPIVEVIIKHLVDELRKRWSTLSAHRPESLSVVTFDIDNGLKYAGREYWRAFGSFMRDVLAFRLTEIRRRLAVHLFGAPDPYEIDQLMRRAEQDADRVITFFLVGDRSTHDHAVSIRGDRMAKKLNGICTWSEIGLHPSYRSMGDEAMIIEELQRLTEGSGKTVEMSRQHFLRFRLPVTYRLLAKAGMKEEHSMGFHDRIGFRAGTCTPFKWYDLEGECTTELVIHPFTVMDSALCYKMRLSVAEAIEQVIDMKRKVRSIGGTFTTIWHERFLAGTGAEQGWDDLFNAVVSNS